MKPFLKINWLERDIEVDHRADGSIVMRSRVPLAPFERCIPAYLRRWSKECPDRVWLAQRRGPEREWLKLTYGQAMAKVDALTQALIDMKLTPEQPVAILSGNSLEHALLTQAAMQAGIPAAPISPAYSLLSQDHAKLRYVFNLLGPKVVMVQDGPPFQAALDALDLSGITVVYVQRPPRLPAGVTCVAFETLQNTRPTDQVQARLATVGPDTVGKLLLTSGSTGMPKAVINTQRMMCANVMMGQQCRPRPPDDPPAVVLDWMPWNHTMGGNASFHSVLADGGTLYIDDGRPVPGQFEESLRNLREISPTYYGNVPAGYAALMAVLERDDELAQSFFRQLRLLGYGGATLPDDLYRRMQALAERWTGHRIVFFTGWGCTETAPTATSTYWETERVGLIGLPHPGVELKLIAVGSPTKEEGQRYEARLRSIIVTPGYYRQPELTAAAFDEEGFYKIGDAATFIDPQDPVKGLVFAGRVVEDFKLMSGTFVSVGSLRVAAIAAASPVIQDALVTGLDRLYAGLLAWINIPSCRILVGRPEATVEELIADPKVIACVRDGLRAHDAAQPGSSTRIDRVLLMTEPPSIDGNELTDKGYINQRAGLQRRHALVDRLYEEPAPADVIVIE